MHIFNITPVFENLAPSRFFFLMIDRRVNSRCQKNLVMTHSVAEEITRSSFASPLEYGLPKD